MNGIRCFWRTAAIVLVGTGCVEDEGDTAPFFVHDSSGVRVVELLRPIADTVRLELDTSWPAAELAPLGDLVDVDVRPDGSIVLLDGFAAEIRVLDRGGQEILRFGGPGAGPGEFNPQGLGGVVSTDTSMIVPDLFQQRVTEFSPGGEVLRTSRFPGEGGYAVDWRSYPDGGLVFRLLQQSGDALLRWQGEQVDTLYKFRGTPSEPNEILSPVALWDIRESSLAVANSAEWAVRLTAVDGSGVQWIARRDGGGKPISERDLTALEDLLVRSAARNAGGSVPTGDARARLLAQVSFPDTKPALGGLRLGADGGVWVREVAEIRDMDQEAMRVGSAEGYGGPWWVVLASDGSLRSHVRLPDGFQVTRIVDGWLYGIQSDELGVERPARVANPW